MYLWVSAFSWLLQRSGHHLVVSVKLLLWRGTTDSEMKVPLCWESRCHRFSSLKSRVCQNRASHALPASKKSAFLIFPSRLFYQLRFSPQLPSNIVSCVLNSESDIYVWEGDMCCTLVWPLWLTGHWISGNKCLNCWQGSTLCLCSRSL